MIGDSFFLKINKEILTVLSSTWAHTLYRCIRIKFFIAEVIVITLLVLHLSNFNIYF